MGHRGVESLKVHHRVCHFDAKGPPVPIPNTEVKLCSADNTCLETSREDRSWRTQAERQKRAEEVRESVILTQRVHLFPFRTQKLSFAVLTILAWRRAGKISRSRHTQKLRSKRNFCAKYSSLAQSVERMTVNHDVAGSSPAGGAKREKSEIIANRRWFRISFVFW